MGLSTRLNLSQAAGTGAGSLGFPPRFLLRNPTDTRGFPRGKLEQVNAP